jgi:hypothetical protein
MIGSDRRIPIAPITIPWTARLLAALVQSVRRLHVPLQPTSASSDEHIAGGTRRKWGEHHGGESIVAAARPSIYGAKPFLEASHGACCTKSPVTFEMRSPRGILLTVRARKAFASIAGSGITTMLEAVTAFFGVMSAGIFIAHAVDGYRSRF